jgi:hypothetical protein
VEDLAIAADAQVIVIVHSAVSAVAVCKTHALRVCFVLQNSVSQHDPKKKKLGVSKTSKEDKAKDEAQGGGVDENDDEQKPTAAAAAKPAASTPATSKATQKKARQEEAATSASKLQQPDGEDEDDEEVKHQHLLCSVYVCVLSLNCRTVSLPCRRMRQVPSLPR